MKIRHPLGLRHPVCISLGVHQCASVCKRAFLVSNCSTTCSYEIARQRDGVRVQFCLHLVWAFVFYIFVHLYFVSVYIHTYTHILIYISTHTHHMYVRVHTYVYWFIPAERLFQSAIAQHLRHTSCPAHHLQCVAVCCSVLQCVAVFCSVLQRVAACCSVLQCVSNTYV